MRLLTSIGKRLSRSTSRIWPMTWVWVTVLTVLAFCLALIAIQARQRDILSRFVDEQALLRQAQIDLSQGYLHVALAVSPAYPFDREQGLALLDQAASSLERAIRLHRESAGAGPGAEDASSALLANFAREVAQFRRLLLSGRGDSRRDPAHEAQLRIAFLALERRAEAIDAHVQANLSRILRHYDELQSLAMWGTVLLLVVISAAVYSGSHSRQRAEEALRQALRDLRQSQSVARLGSYRLEPQTGRWTCTEALHEIFGIDPACIKTVEGWAGLVHPDDRDAVRRYLEEEVLGRRKRFDREYRIRSVPERGDVWVHQWGDLQLGADGEVSAVFGIIQDVTERKRVEQVLRDSDQRKNEFLGVLSHELRNPLAPIRNSLYVLERTAVLEEPARRALTVIGRQVTHLAHLVDDLLEVTRITQGKIHLHPQRLDLGEVVRRTVDDYRPEFEAKGVRLAGPSGDGELWIQGDVTRIAQVVGNLLGNAIKFTPPGGEVEVGLQREGTMALMRVRDSGVGIAPELIGQLFQPFSQAPQTLARTQGGLGLGLALVKRLIELHGGSVDAASEGLGQGAEFTVRLPLEESAASAG